MDKCNGEEQVRLRLMNQYGHVKMSSGSYNLMIKTGACVASTMKEIEWNAQGKGMTYRAFHFTHHRCVEKFMTGFRIDVHIIKRGKLVCILVS
jgi:hypothetical protein